MKAILTLFFILFLLKPLSAIDKKYLNIIIIADLSDRNLRDKNNLPKFPVDYDQAVIDEVLKIFKENVRKNLYIASKDRITFISLPENDKVFSSYGINESALNINISEIDIRSRRTKLNEYILSFSMNIKKVYSATINEKTIGADIWSFFKYDLEKLLIEGPNFRNVIILLSDGYLYFNKEYKKNRMSSVNGATFMNVSQKHYPLSKSIDPIKLLPIGKNFTSTEILLAGIDPIIKYSDQEFAFIHNCWAEWFDSMKIKYEIVKLNKSKPTIAATVEKFFNK